MNWGNRHELFSIFFIENELFTENVTEGFTVMNQTVERFNLHSRHVYHSKQNFVLAFELYNFFQKKCIFLSKKNWTFRRRKFFRNRKLKKKLSVTLQITKFRFFWYLYQSCSSKMWEFDSIEVVNFKLFRRAIFLRAFVKYWWTVMAFKPP